MLTGYSFVVLLGLGAMAAQPAEQAAPPPEHSAAQAPRPAPRPVGDVCSECRPAISRRIFVATPGGSSSLPSGVSWQSIAAAVAGKLRSVAAIETFDVSSQQTVAPRPTDLELRLVVVETRRSEAPTASAPPRAAAVNATNQAEADRLDAMAADLEQQASARQASAASRTVSADDALCGAVICMLTTDRFGNVNQAAYNACLERQNRCVEAASARATEENERIRMETETEVNGLLTRARSLRSDAERLRHDTGAAASPATSLPARTAPTGYELRWSLAEARGGAAIGGGSFPATDVAGTAARPRETLFEPTQPPAGWVPPAVDRLAGLVAAAVAQEASTLPFTIHVTAVGSVLRADVGTASGVRRGDFFRLRDASSDASASVEPATSQTPKTVYRVIEVDARSCKLEAVGPHQITSPGDRLEWFGLEKAKE